MNSPYIFLTSTSDGGQWLVSRSSRLNPRYTLNKRQRGAHKRSGRFKNKKYLLLLPGIEPRFLGRPSCSLVTTVTDLCDRVNFVTTNKRFGESCCPVIRVEEAADLSKKLLCMSQLHVVTSHTRDTFAVNTLCSTKTELACSPNSEVSKQDPSYKIIYKHA
jgi:hypothetical protein